MRQNPQDPQNHAFAGDLQMQLGANEKARESYENALRLNPEMLPALVGKARASLSLGRYSEAEAALNHARKVAPDHPVIRRLDQQLKNASQ
jgi:cytochrome c-type biogenesis protein CcmH/NrfG